MTLQVFYSPAYVGSAYAFDTTRKSQWIAESLSERPIPGVELHVPEPLTEAEVVQVHDADYVRAVRMGEPRGLAESQGFAWDAGLWSMVLSSNGGAVAAAREALKSGRAGSLSSGLHHARRHGGAGFCTFNGLVLAAKAALAAGAGAVLILDLDAHCGGGTYELIASEPSIWQVDVSVNGFDRYAPAPPRTLDLVSESEQYLPTIRRRLAEVERAGPTFGLCLYNAGMDPYEGCSTGGLKGIDFQVLAERESLVFEWCSRRALPIAFVLAGGYVGPSLKEQELVELHRLTLSAAVSA
jgi:acetoin utilization deacetylase AcuC-like enzyme